ncbi:hypothetical protein [Sinobacterium caligoides]|uniref:hypothetical protein n=1 Tax=Sinobacterium caligoides TaxID=933926 RepID=UPI001B870A7F|nr:hypothetical protein [Sinobacterium caligoides]
MINRPMLQPSNSGRVLLMPKLAPEFASNRVLMPGAMEATNEKVAAAKSVVKLAKVNMGAVSILLLESLWLYGAILCLSDEKKIL